MYPGRSIASCWNVQQTSDLCACQQRNKVLLLYGSNTYFMWKYDKKYIKFVRCCYSGFLWYSVSQCLNVPMIKIIHSSILCKWANLQNQIIIAPTVYWLYRHWIARLFQTQQDLPLALPYTEGSFLLQIRYWGLRNLVLVNNNPTMYKIQFVLIQSA